MAEYGIEKQAQLSRAVANNRVVCKPFKNIIDNRPIKMLQNNIIQGLFNAGIGTNWHIHYADHIKYNDNNHTRVNFRNRTKRRIFMQLGQKINEQNLANTTGNPCFIACRNWIRDHIG